MSLPSIAFVFCVEAGPLEPKARLLVQSIRRWGGKLSSVPLIAYQPRGCEALSPETLDCFGKFSVQYRAGYFNRDDAENPWANKIHACAHLASTADFELLAFFDTDTVLINEPRELLLAEGMEFAARPVVRKFGGTTGRKGDSNEAWWQALYAAAAVAPPPFVNTAEDAVSIRAYYNGGLFVFRTASDFAGRWVRMARLAKPLIPAKFSHNLDQISLALAAAAAPKRVVKLSPVYNYPIIRRDALVGPERSYAVHKLVHLHYHQAFNARGFLSTVRPSLDVSDERLRWLVARLPLEPEIPLASLKVHRREPLKRALKNFRHRVRWAIGDAIA